MNFDEEMLVKIDNGEKLTEWEIRQLVFNCEVDEIEGDEGRWSRSIETIVELGDRFFSIDWARGLTEYQENEFYCQPVEVELYEYEKVIKVKEWKRI